MMLEERVNEAIVLALGIACKKMLHQDAQDIAQMAVIECADSLLDDHWKEEVVRATKRIYIAERRRIRADEKMKEAYKEWKMNRVKYIMKRKEELRDFLEDVLKPREWQVLHRLYWGERTQEQVAAELGVTQPFISMTHVDALHNIRMAFRRVGINRRNVWNWYYGMQ
jgi:DNA-directed RNA polymerase specialized sigma subunit